MNRLGLAEKQLPRWEIENIESMNPSLEQPGPSDLLAQARRSMNIVTASSMSATQRPKRRFYIPTRSLFAQGSVGVSHSLEKPAKLVAYLSNISTSQIVTFKRVSPSEGHDETHLPFNIWPRSEERQILVTCFIDPLAGSGSFLQQAMEAMSMPAKTLQNRYKELSSKRYMGSLTSDETLELTNLEEQLDELDANDADLQTFMGRIDEGYDKLRRGLREINGILDDLLRH